MPFEPLIDVSGRANVVMRGFALATQHVDEPSPDAVHKAKGSGIFRASEKPEEFLAMAKSKRAVRSSANGRRAGEDQKLRSGRRRSDFARYAGFVETASARGQFAPPSQASGLRRLACLAVAHAKSVSGGWLAALDDFRNWLIREAA